MKLFEIVGLKEDASTGSTSSGSVATVATPLGAVHRRIPDSMLTGIETTDATPNTPKEYKAYKKKKTKL
jgi:hypothetical protein